MTDKPKTKRRWLQYSLRTLFFLILLIALALGWFAVRRQSAERQRLALEKLDRSHASIFYDVYRNEQIAFNFESQPYGPIWLRRWLGIDFYHDVFEVRFSIGLSGEFGPLDLKLIEDVKELRNWEAIRIYLSRISSSQIAELAEIDVLNRVAFISISFDDYSDVSDVHMPYIEGFHNLLGLDLGRSKVTHEGFGHLQSLSNLEWLSLNATDFGDADIRHLRKLLSLRQLMLDRTRITDASLVHLKGLTKLKELYINDTQITDAGLEQLKELTNLTYLSLVATPITDEGVKKLQRALPKCNILH